MIATQERYEKGVRRKRSENGVSQPPTKGDEETEGGWSGKNVCKQKRRGQTEVTYIWRGIHEDTKMVLVMKVPRGFI